MFNRLFELFFKVITKKKYFAWSFSINRLDSIQLLIKNLSQLFMLTKVYQPLAEKPASNI